MGTLIKIVPWFKTLQNGIVQPALFLCKFHLMLVWIWLKKGTQYLNIGLTHPINIIFNVASCCLGGKEFICSVSNADSNSGGVSCDWNFSRISI